MVHKYLTLTKKQQEVNFAFRVVVISDYTIDNYAIGLMLVGRVNGLTPRSEF